MACSEVAHKCLSSASDDATVADFLRFLIAQSPHDPKRAPLDSTCSASLEEMQLTAFHTCREWPALDRSMAMHPCRNPGQRLEIWIPKREIEGLQLQTEITRVLLVMRTVGGRSPLPHLSCSSQQ